MLCLKANLDSEVENHTLMTSLFKGSLLAVGERWMRGLEHALDKVSHKQPLLKLKCTG